MHENLTPRLLTLVKNARKKAIEFKSKNIGSEHTFLAWLETKSGTTIDYIKTKDVSIDKIKEEVLRLVTSESSDLFDSTNPPVNNEELNAVFVEAKKFADKLGQNYVGIEHFLIALFSNKELAICKTLIGLGLDVTSIKDKIIADLNTKAASEPSKVPMGGPSESRSERGQESVIQKFSTELVERASKGLIDPVIGRDEEVGRVIRILARRRKNNPVLVGPAGVGKTSVVEGLALKIANKDVPEILLQKRIFALDLGRVVAGTTYRGQFEERMKRIMEEVKGNPNFIVFIDEIHTVIGAGGAEGTLDASNMLKPALARGEFPCIAATTVDEYRMYIERDSALERRFQLVHVNEPNAEQTVKILAASTKIYETFHGVTYPEEVIQATVELSNRYITDRNQPDKGFDVIDEIGAKVKLIEPKPSVAMNELRDGLEKILTLKKTAVEEEKYEDAEKYKETEDKLRFKIRKLEEATKEKNKVVKLEHVYEVISAWTGVPVGDLNASDKNNLVNLENVLNEIVVGQESAVKEVAKAIKKYKTPIKDQTRPIGGGGFLFCGPTGVGKTLLAKTIAVKVFGGEKKLIKLDGSEYSDAISVNKLIGTGAGYVGYNESGSLCKFVQKNPYSVILFDEIEKAHHNISQLLLQILEDGKITDNHGKIVNFANTIIILTSNVGVAAEKIIGFGSEEEIKDKQRASLINEIKKYFSPELLNRLQVIDFKALSEEQVKKVVDNEIEILNKRLNSSKIRIVYDKEVVDYILKEGYNQSFGARNIRKQVEMLIEDKIVDSFLTDDLKENTLITFKIVNNKLDFSISKKRCPVVAK